MDKRNGKIANLQFVLSIFIVLIHASCLFINVPGQSLQSIFGPNWSAFFQLYIGEGICRVAVPMFFIFSGYLFYLSFDGTAKKYLQKLKRRVSSLVVPYFFWSASTFLAFFLAQKLLGLDMFFSTRNSEMIDLQYLLDNIVLNSYDSPLWYCRYLIVFSLFSIVMYYPLKKLPILSVVLCTVFYFCNGIFISLPVRENSIFFYCLGAVIALNKSVFVKLSVKVNKCATVAFVLLFLIALVFRTWYFCYQDPDYLLIGTENAVLTYSEKVIILLGLCAIWFGYEVISDNAASWKLADYSFLIFAAHHPIVSTIKKLMMGKMGVSNGSAAITFILSTVITVVVIIAIGQLVRKYMPLVWKIATGNR